VFVNPTQFGPSEDFTRYPRNLDQDVRLASEAGTDYVFAPSTQAIYPEGYRTYIEVEQLTSFLEGKSRPGHFRGVATIVAKLFNITKPHAAIFGQKDAQQVVVVKQMIRDLNFDIELVISPIVREHDGLAMSSRNTYLSQEQRSEAPILYKSLVLAETLLHGGERRARDVTRQMRDLIATNSRGNIDYISIADAVTLEEVDDCNGDLLISLAVRFGNTRLIDNTIVRV
jgi:pantoate--beta-alanine ligase